MFLTSYIGTQIHISRIEGLTGAVPWTYVFTPFDNKYCVSNYRQVGTEHLHYTLVGDAGFVKVLARLIIDPATRNPVGLKGDIFMETSTTNLNWVPIAVQGLSSRYIQALFYDKSTMIVYCTVYDLVDLGLWNRKIFP